MHIISCISLAKLYYINTVFAKMKLKKNIKKWETKTSVQIEMMFLSIDSVYVKLIFI